MQRALLDRFNRVEKATWELPTTYRKKMKVPVRVVATEKLLQAMDDGAVDQAVNFAQLPGIVGASFVMPDAHWGYGMPVGGVAAFALSDGIISPGAIGFDINCGMRLLVTNLTVKDVKPHIKELVNELFENIPSGVGGTGFVHLNEQEFKEVMVRGARWAIEQGLGWEEDKDAIEEEGAISGADPEAISEKAVKRGINQLGTLGSGNHYLEVQRVDTVFDPKEAEKHGIVAKDQVVVMIHCGSRGFGHQVATDYLRTFEKKMEDYGITVPDRQLAAVPYDTPLGKRYYSAMAAAANNAFCNRQVIMHQAREVFSQVFGKSAQDLGMKLVYDVAHNIAKIEKYNGEEVLVHRKGATRAFPGQPVIIGGSMETGSYLLVGTEEALAKTFGSTAHGSGRTMSRTKAKKMVRGEKLHKELEKQGIYVKTASFSGLAEEAGIAYKDINEVVKAVSDAGISAPVAYFKPLGNIKG